MTIKELYEWAVKNKVENCDLTIPDRFGCYTDIVQPEIVKRFNGELVVVEL